jgi:EAL domain-containing protein (putative c-di-GMP-specific phosphodiesterase class I)
LLELEVTESALMEDSATTTETLRALQALGVQMAFDDFGTGYSSLSHLKRMPLGNLKIDKSFVMGLPEDAENLAIVRAILAMSSSLGLTVTAEGVETLEQAQVLKSMACGTLQGYFFSKPVPAAAIPDLLSQCWLLDERLPSGFISLKKIRSAEASCVLHPMTESIFCKNASLAEAEVFKRVGVGR